MVFHSINISKVILNSFLRFWSLDYVLESFCALGWDFHHSGWENLIFCQIFVWDWFLLIFFFGCWPFVAKRTCIKGEFHDVHALLYIVIHSVHARCLIKCLLSIFSLVWTPMSTKLWSFSWFNTPCPTCAFSMLWSCIAHSHLLHTPLLPLSCIGLYLISSS